MLDLAGLNRRPSSAWSRRWGRPDWPLWLAAEPGGCGCCGRWKVRGCFAGVLIAELGDWLVPGWLPVWLGWWCWCFLGLLRALIFLGSLWGSSGGGRFSLPWSLEGGGWSSCIQLRWRSQGGGVTILFRFHNCLKLGIDLQMALTHVLWVGILEMKCGVQLNHFGNSPEGMISPNNEKAWTPRYLPFPFVNETGSRSPCMRPRSDPPNFGPMERCEKQTNNID